MIKKVRIDFVKTLFLAFFILHIKTSFASVDSIYFGLQGDYTLEVVGHCVYDTALGFWPYANCSGGVRTDLPDDHEMYVGDKKVTNFPYSDTNYYPEEICDWRLIPDVCASIRERNRESALSRAKIDFVRSGPGHEIFLRLYRPYQAKFKIDGESYYYDNFKSTVDEMFDDLSASFNSRIKRERTEILLASGTGFTGIALASYFLWFLRRKMNFFVKHKMPKMKQDLYDVKEDFATKRRFKTFEKSALDEAARISIRESLKRFDAGDVDVVQKQINDAVLRGDYKTAESLASTLKKMQGGE